MASTLTVVRWNPDRGFGFVRLEDGREAFLHVTNIEPKQSRGVDLRDSKIEVHRVTKGQKGLRIASATLSEWLAEERKRAAESARRAEQLRKEREVKKAEEKRQRQERRARLTAKAQEAYLAVGSDDGVPDPPPEKTYCPTCGEYVEYRLEERPTGDGPAVLRVCSVCGRRIRPHSDLPSHSVFGSVKICALGHDALQKDHACPDGPYAGTCVVGCVRGGCKHERSVAVAWSNSERACRGAYIQPWKGPCPARGDQIEVLPEGFYRCRRCGWTWHEFAPKPPAVVDFGGGEGPMQRGLFG